MLAGESELLGENACCRYGFHFRNGRIRVFDAHEEQANCGVANCQLGYCANERVGVKPVVDATAPDNDLVALVNAWHHPAQCGIALHRIHTRNSERGLGNQRIKIVVTRVRVGIYAAKR